MTGRDRAETLRELLSARARPGSALAGGGTDCVRLCAGLGDGVPGLIVDRFGPLVVAVDYADGGMTAEALLGLVREIFPEHHVIAKVRSFEHGTKDGAHGTKDGTNKFATAAHHPARGAGPDAAPLIAMERGLKFEIGVDPAHDFGLYLDAAKARLFVRQSARGQRVLNLFSYAGAFGVAAAAGGAIDVANVDPNRDYLTWSLRNAALNGVTMRVLPDKAQDHLARHLRRLARDPHRANYNLVIVDPPAFGIGRGNERVLRLLCPELFASLLAMRPRTLVLLSNDKAFRARQSFVELVETE